MNLRLASVALLCLGLVFADDDDDKKHHHRHRSHHKQDGIFDNFGQAQPVVHGHGGGGGGGVEVVVPVVAEGVGVGVGQPQDGHADDSFDPRLPDPPCLWTAWSECDAACGGGSAYRLRRLTEECAYGPAHQLKLCNAQPCAENCLLGEWTSWGCDGGCGGCSAPCGGGQRSRQRPVLRPALFGGVCEDPAVETETCNEHACPLDCIAVTDWEEWGPCSQGCGGGRRRRERQVQTVSSVRPGRSHTEAECPESSQEENCGLQPCPIDCVLDEAQPWSGWSLCSASCGTDGTQIRQRPIVRRPQNGGAECPPTLEIRSCLDELPACTPAEQPPVPEPERSNPWDKLVGDPIILPPLPTANTYAPLPPVIQDVPETTTQLSIPPGFCNDRPDGPYSHPDCQCCNDLIMCFQRSAILKWCPPGEIFVSQWAKCASPYEAPGC